MAGKAHGIVSGSSLESINVLLSTIEHKKNYAILETPILWCFLSEKVGSNPSFSVESPKSSKIGTSGVFLYPKSTPFWGKNGVQIIIIKLKNASLHCIINQIKEHTSCHRVENAEAFVSISLGLRRYTCECLL